MNIQTTGDIRSKLISLMGKVESGNMNIECADIIIKAASQINHSIAVELKVQKFQKESGEHKQNFGSLRVVDAKDER